MILAMATARAYYNEIDSFAAGWLRNLISAGLIAPGDVDTRSIKDVTADDVRGYTQCHWFAGIGGWSQALRLAGWPDDVAVWTGSCPCQPFSAAGKRKGADDERHLWPEFRRLISECAPSVVFGEQVASADGRKWLAGVRADMEELGYGVGAADLCAAGEGAPHIRQRLWWVAESEGAGRRADIGAIRSRQDARLREEEGQDERRPIEQAGRPGDSCTTGRLDFPQSQRNRTPANAGSNCQSEGEGRECGTGGSSAFGRLGDTEGGRLSIGGDASQSLDGGYPVSAGWSAFGIVPCSDGKSRRIEPGSFPLAARIPVSMGRGRSKLERVAIRAARANRTGRLKGYGNSIVPQVAAEFIGAFMEVKAEERIEQ